MIASIIAALIALAKGSAAFDSILAQLTEAYRVHAITRNNALKSDKDARNEALVGGARLGTGVCPVCGGVDREKTPRIS